MDKGTKHIKYKENIGTATMENNIEFPQKTKVELSKDPSISLLSIYPEKTIIQKDTCTSMFHCSTIYNSQDMEAT